MANEIEVTQGGITDLQRLREFVKSLPQEFKKIFIKNTMEERNHDLFSQEDMETYFILEYLDELEEAGWLVVE
ncbi:hypothetical protein [uncultured Methanobrevibacter sp.]|uniref:hypothetical protein n=1 Tax=uncultured Methanobrevibacter sp. TaxID=253161 RepID=UPI0025FF42A0|nr:hypothetical protein [uncultured Methanobrevibacter sp.]